MLRTISWGRIIVALLLLTQGMFAAFLESDFPERAEPQGPRPPRHPIPIPPPPLQENEVSALISNCIVGQPFSHGGLTVYPISLRRELDNNAYLSMDEAIRSGNLEVQETGTVSEVIMVNRGRRSVFGMSGEILIGGRQNRTLRDDVLLYPDRQARVPVYCVEKGRWEGDAKSFESRSSMVLPGIRYRAAQGASQDSVWKDISESAGKLSVESRTQNFQAVYESEAVRKEIADYRRAFMPVWRARPAGLVVCRFGRIVGAEIFGSSAIFSQLQHKILDSYVVDRLHYPAMERMPIGQDPDVWGFLNRVHRATMNYGYTPGDGRSIMISGAASGRALSAGGAVVHLSLYEQVAILDHRRE